MLWEQLRFGRGARANYISLPIVLFHLSFGPFKINYKKKKKKFTEYILPKNDETHGSWLLKSKNGNEPCTKQKGKKKKKKIQTNVYAWRMGQFRGSTRG